MTLSRGFRGDAGNVRRTAVRVVAAVLVGAAMSAAIWAGPAAAASGSRAQSRASASPSPARVKYYIVPKARNGVAPSLYAIAARTLGDGNLFTEIFDLNKGRLQPHGGRLENPQEILAGWILELPADASGPGVHFGRLPGTSPPPAAAVSPRPSRPAPDGPAAHRSPVSWADGGGVIVIIVVAAGLAVGLRRRRAAGAVRRKPTHARGSGPRPGARTGPAAPSAPGIRAADSSRPGVGYPSFPDADHPSFPGVNHPSFPGADHPSFPGAGPSWSAADYPSFPGADHPSFPGAARVGRQPTTRASLEQTTRASPAARVGRQPTTRTGRRQHRCRLYQGYGPGRRLETAGCAARRRTRLAATVVSAGSRHSGHGGPGAA